MPETTDGYGVLVAVDGSVESEAALRWAGREAALYDERVTLMHVISPVVVSWPVGYLEASFGEWQVQNAKDVLEQAQKTVLAAAGDSALPSVHTEVRHDVVVPALVEASRNARMIVVGSRGMGAVGRAVLGSVGGGLLHHSRCPVAVVHKDEAQAPDSTSPVLLGVDGSPASEAATALAFEEASRRRVDLVALHSWSDVNMSVILGMDWSQYEQEGQEVLAERLAGWQERYPDVRVERRIVSDRPARRLIDESRQAQLVVVGSRGRGGFTGMLLGSVSTAVAEEAKAPVIVVRS